MATKTISLELDAYEKLKRAKKGRESFSAVVRRCLLPEQEKSGRDVLEYLRSRREFLSDEALNAAEKAASHDIPPANPWDEEA